MRIDNTVGVAKVSQTLLEVAGREVTITNPDKVFFPQAGHTKLDLAKYYAAVADGALRGIAGRPIERVRVLAEDDAIGIAVADNALPIGNCCANPR